jgi:hypothetical protein
MVDKIGVKSQLMGFERYRIVTKYNKLFHTEKCLFDKHNTYYIISYYNDNMSTITLSDLETCTIYFPDKKEQVKAFNYLIHSRIGFTGVDENTIRLKERYCAELDSKNIQYQKSY